MSIAPHLCRAVTDWAATGSMIQGIGTILGALAVLYAARAGRTALSDWRNQKLEEIRIERAERILTAVYNGQRSLADVRRSFVPAHELAAAGEKLKANGADPKDVGKARWSKLESAQAALTRIALADAAWQELEACRPATKAFFGNDLDEQLEKLVRQVIAVQIAADMYADDNGSDPEFSMGLRRDMWAGGGKEEGNAVTKATNEAVRAAERILLPVINPQAAVPAAEISEA